MGRDLKILQGSWNIVHMEMDGQRMLGGGARIVVSGDRFTTLGMGAVYEGTVEVHPRTAPKSFELHFEEGPEKGNTSFGIYELDGDTWKICLTTRGSERPAEFAAPPGTGIALELLQRDTGVRTVAPEAAAAPGVPSGEPAPELAGEWAALSLQRDGQSLPPSMLQHGRRIATADEVTVQFGPNVILRARYAVDRGRSPMTMDYVRADGKTQYGIWAFDGRRLTTCFSAPGKPRPGEFEAGAGRTLAVWTPDAR